MGYNQTGMSERKPELVDARDGAYADLQGDPALRETILCSVVKYRRADKLAVGDAAPSLSLTDMDSRAQVALGGRSVRPRALFFGSYT